jgi:AraC-like DNA-binding protein
MIWWFFFGFLVGMAVMLVSIGVIMYVRKKTRPDELIAVEGAAATDESGQKDLFMTKLQNVMNQQMDNNTLTVDELVEEMNMGRTVFFNKLKNLTGLSPVEFIREMRIKRAAQLLEDRKYNITEVTYMVGMNDSRYFSKCFKNTYGVTPSEYRKQRLGENVKD